MSVEERIRRLIRPEIRELKAYAVADPGDAIKLDAMENPYPWPEDIKQAWLERLRSVALNRYPDPAARALQGPLREAMEVPAEMGLLLGNGSDELIQMILLALARPGAKVLAPVPGFVMYALTARVAGMEFVGVPLKSDDFALDREAMLAAIREQRPAVVFLAYPNNPTGNLFETGDMEAVIEAAEGLVVVDEAYHAFAGESFMGRLGEYDNLLVMRTVSKLGLAGLRLGLLAGEPAWLAELDKLRLPYNINSLTQASAQFILSRRQVLEGQTARIREQREVLYRELTALPGLRVWPSRANFILFRIVPGRAGAVHADLRRAGILIKNLDGSDPRLRDCLRVTVGTEAENRAFLEALRGLL